VNSIRFASQQSGWTSSDLKIFAKWISQRCLSSCSIAFFGMRKYMEILKRWLQYQDNFQTVYNGNMDVTCCFMWMGDVYWDVALECISSFSVSWDWHLSKMQIMESSKFHWVLSSSLKKIASMLPAWLGCSLCFLNSGCDQSYEHCALGKSNRWVASLDPDHRISFFDTIRQMTLRCCHCPTIFVTSYGASSSGFSISIYIPFVQTSTFVLHV
jgi:hypothetical protein